MRRSAASLALLLAACSPSQPAPKDSPKDAPAAPAASPDVAPPAAPAAPVPGDSTGPAAATGDAHWWCTCYVRIGPEPMTACRQSQDDCKALEKKATTGEAGIVAGSLTHVCREVRGAHPGDGLGGRDGWEPSKKPGAFIRVGPCALAGPPDAPPPAAAEEDADGEPPNVLKDESFAGLKLGMSEAEAVAVVGQPVKKDRAQFWGATDTYESTWHYPALGLELGMSGDKKTGPWKLGRLTAKAPSTSRTSRGIGIGDPKSAVEAAYGKDRDRDGAGSDDVFIAGSVYWGVFFTFDATTKNVREIFFGAGAE